MGSEERRFRGIKLFNNICQYWQVVSGRVPCGWLLRLGLKYLSEVMTRMVKHLMVTLRIVQRFGTAKVIVTRLMFLS